MRVYRIKHLPTGKYLALDMLGRFYTSKTGIFTNKVDMNFIFEDDEYAECYHNDVLIKIYPNTVEIEIYELVRIKDE